MVLWFSFWCCLNHTLKLKHIYVMCISLICVYWAMCVLLCILLYGGMCYVLGLLVFLCDVCWFILCVLKWSICFFFCMYPICCRVSYQYPCDVLLLVWFPYKLIFNIVLCVFVCITKVKYSYMCCAIWLFV